jgi:hypothetical protein
MGHPINEVLKEAPKVHNIKLTDNHHRPCPHCVKDKHGNQDGGAYFNQHLLD